MPPTPWPNSASSRRPRPRKSGTRARTAKFDVARIDEIEREIKHDVIAFLTHLAEIVGPEARFVHSGHDLVRRARHLLQRAAGARRRHSDRRRRQAARGAQAPRVRAQEDADDRPLPRHPRRADHLRPQARVCLCRVLARAGAAGCGAQGGRDLRDLRRGRHVRAGRPAGRSACRQGDGPGARAGVDPDHPARPPRHVSSRRSAWSRRRSSGSRPKSATCSAPRCWRPRSSSRPGRRAPRRCRTSATRC